MLKGYQQRVVTEVETFFSELDTARTAFKAFSTSPAFQAFGGYLPLAFGKPPYSQFPDRPRTGSNELYPRVCIKMPTGGGKTLIAIETIRAYQNLFAKRRTGLVVWITHREQIYRQTIENLQDKGHVYRQLLDQASGNRTLIVEKGQSIRAQDVEENLVVLMLMIQSAARDGNKIFEDSGGYTDFFPTENRYDQHAELLKRVPNLDKTDDTLFAQRLVKTSLGNVIRTMKPLIIVDELHTMFTDNARATLDGLNPSVLVGLSATPKIGMNILSSVTGKDLKAEDMIKLDLHLRPSKDWQDMLVSIKQKRDELEKCATDLEQNKGVYIRPIALIQVERTGKEQRGSGLVHSEDAREFLMSLGVAKHEIAVKSSSIDEIKQQKLLSKESEVRYVITKDALKEGWDCSFAYILGVIPNASSNTSMTQLVGRILRQPYAKKTGIPDLDESYVYFAKGQTQEVVEKVQRGFEDEGLGDLKGGMEVRDASGKVVYQTKQVGIKKSVQAKYPESLFLPVWLIKKGKAHRRFSYEMDIRPNVDWSALNLKECIAALAQTVGGQRSIQEEVIVGLEGDATARQIETTSVLNFDTMYLTRRIFETVDNAFVAHGIAADVIKMLKKEFAADVLNKDAGFIAYEIERALLAYKRTQEKKVFESLVTNGSLVLGVSDDEKLGFAMPQHDVVANQIPSAYTTSLYEDVDLSALNSLEQKVINIIDRSPNVLWWARNKVERGWYSVQGWHKGKIRPDFVVARKNAKEELEFVYVVESKGEQLVGNTDTEYKASVFDTMNSMKGRVEKIQYKTTTVRMNEHFEFEIVPQGEEDVALRRKLNS